MRPAASGERWAAVGAAAAVGVAVAESEAIWEMGCCVLLLPLPAALFLICKATNLSSATAAAAAAAAPQLHVDTITDVAREILFPCISRLQKTMRWRRKMYFQPRMIRRFTFLLVLSRGTRLACLSYSRAQPWFLKYLEILKK